LQNPSAEPCHVRIGEATTITLDKLQLDRHQVVIGLEGKGRRERIVPIGDPTKRDGGRAIRALREYLSKRPESERSVHRLFLGQGGYPLNP
jgi:site-specific recombinase XerC